MTNDLFAKEQAEHEEDIIRRGACVVCGLGGEGYAASPDNPLEAVAYVGLDEVWYVHKKCLPEWIENTDPDEG
jgi:hypothetical protein